MNKLKTWFSKHKILTGVLAAGILAAIIFFVTRPSESASYSSTSLKPQDLRIYNSFVGTVQPNSDYRIIPKVSSLVTSVRVKEGDYVEKGQVIAVMDDTAAQYQIALKQAMMAQNGTSSYYNIKDAETAYQNYKTALENGLNSSLLSAGRSLDSAALSLDHAEDALESGLNSADAAVSAAARRVRDAKETVKVTKEALPDPETIGRVTQEYMDAETALNSAESTLSLAASAQELARLAYEAEPEDSPEKEAKQAAWSEAVQAETEARSAYDESFAVYEGIEPVYTAMQGSLKAYDAAMKEYNAAGEAYVTAKHSRSDTEDKLEQTVENSQLDFESSQRSYNAAALSVQQQLRDYENTIARIKANSADKSSQIELDHLQKSLEDYVITAPVSGTVTSLSLHEGEVAATNSAAAVISGLDIMSIQIKIDEYSVINAKEGMPVEIYVDAIGRNYQGTIRSIANTADNNQGISYYSANVDFPSDEVVRSGMSCEVRLDIINHSGAMCLPAEAVLFHPDNTAYVRVKDGAGMKEVPVETGDSDGIYTEIKSGLSADDIVLYTPSVRKPSEENVVTLG